MIECFPRTTSNSIIEISDAIQILSTISEFVYSWYLIVEIIFQNSVSTEKLSFMILKTLEYSYKCVAMSWKRADFFSTILINFSPGMQRAKKKGTQLSPSVKLNIKKHYSQPIKISYFFKYHKDMVDFETKPFFFRNVIEIFRNNRRKIYGVSAFDCGTVLNIWYKVASFRRTNLFGDARAGHNKRELCEV